MTRVSPAIDNFLNIISVNLALVQWTIAVNIETGFIKRPALADRIG